MLQSYTYEFKKKIVRLHVEEGRSYKSITEEYGVSKTSQSKWCREFSKKGQTKAEATPEEPNEMDLMKENRRSKRNFVAFWRKMAYNQMLKSNEKYRRGPRAF